LPFAIGAVVVGVPTTFQTPLSGHFSPVRAVVPIGLRVCVVEYVINVSFLKLKWGRFSLLNANEDAY
jgi:hypothetical protein